MKVFYLNKGLTVHVDYSEEKPRIVRDVAHGFEVLNESFEKTGTFEGCFRDYLKLSGKKTVCIAIGFFDGVHLGHQEVIKAMTDDARKYDALSVVVTFDKHPQNVISHRTPLLISTLAHKMRLLDRFGVSYTLLLPFNLELSRLPAECFVECLYNELGSLATVSVGQNFLFGHNREGDVNLLNRMGVKLGFTARGIKPVTIDGKRISSTRIRESIKKGELEFVSRMLGRKYSIYTDIIRGAGLGKKIGFPTANMDINGLGLPPCGVYAAQVIIGNERFNGILNLGYKPTVSGKNPLLTCEVHIFDFNRDIYSDKIEVEFLDKIRDEKKFGSLEELKLQIKNDIQIARQLFETKYKVVC
jgi:riboflavin kinase/FMN adenylyltransferase